MIKEILLWTLSLAILAIVVLFIWALCLHPKVFIVSFLVLLLTMFIRYTLIEGLYGNSN